jgi:hypothetical protein
MGSCATIDAYLDQVCARLRVNPAEADDMREELRSHLEELIASYSAGGVDRHEAIDLALAWFGDAHKVHDTLDLVHRGDPWWLSRLKGMALGCMLGAILIFLIPFGGHIEFLARLIPSLSDIPAAMLNALLVGAIIGLVSSGGRSLFLGWVIGSLIWLTEYAYYWIMTIAENSTSELSGMLWSLLLSPLIGGGFGAMVGIGTASMLSRLSRVRPEIR